MTDHLLGICACFVLSKPVEWISAPTVKSHVFCRSNTKSYWHCPRDVQSTRVCVTVRCPSVRLSVPDRAEEQLCNRAAVARGHSTALSSKRGQCRVYSQGTWLCTYLFVKLFLKSDWLSHRSWLVRGSHASWKVLEFFLWIFKGLERAEKMRSVQESAGNRSLSSWQILEFTVKELLTAPSSVMDSSYPVAHCKLCASVYSCNSSIAWLPSRCWCRRGLSVLIILSVIVLSHLFRRTVCYFVTSHAVMSPV